jgi:hypothetical protein
MEVLAKAVNRFALKPRLYQEISMVSNVFHIPDGRYTYFVEMYINGMHVQAFPDNHSEINIISEHYLIHHHNELRLDKDTETIIRLPDDRRIKATGTVEAQYRFAESDKTFTVEFTVLPGCLHKVVLSNSFLQITQTLLVLGHRIKHESHKPTAPMQVCLNGSPYQHVVGFINGKRVLAAPDIGSNVNVITEDCAVDLGLVIDQDSNQSFLQFFDGSDISTCGIVRDAEWRFDETSRTPPNARNTTETQALRVSVADREIGTDTLPGDTFICDLLVVKKLVVLVIPSSILLYSTNAFTACPGHFWADRRVRGCTAN